MATILETAEQANIDAGIRTLSFANLQEFQSFMDSFTFQEWPVNVLVPFTVNGTTNMNTGIRKAVVLLQGWVLTRVPEEPNDYRSKAYEAKYLNPMRVLAKKFIKSMVNSDIVDRDVDSISDAIVPEYMFLNAHTFGVSYTLSLPIRDNV